MWKNNFIKERDYLNVVWMVTRPRGWLTIHSNFEISKIGQATAWLAWPVPTPWVVYLWSHHTDVSTSCKISGGYAYCLLYPGGWFARSMDSQHPGSSKPMHLLNLLLSGVICMCRASLIFNSRFLLALSTTLTYRIVSWRSTKLYTYRWHLTTTSLTDT